IPGERPPQCLALLGMASRNADVQAAALRAFSIREDEPVRIGEPASRRLLGSNSPAVRLAAADAFARGRLESVDVLWESLTRQPDRIEEHALIHAIHKLSDKGNDLIEKLGHGNPRVQKAALLLLDQPPRPKGLLKPEAVIQRTSAADAELRQTALR